MEEKHHLAIFEQFANFMEHETRAVQMVIYGIPSVGLSLALYKIRPFSKFVKPFDIPNHFISNKVPLHGVVEHIEPAHGPGALLMVNHKSLIPIQNLYKRNKCLPIKIAGVNVTGHGISWLQTIVNQKNIVFIPLSKEKEYVNCVVKLPLKNKEYSQIGEELVKLGFALCDPPKPLSKDEDKAYTKSLRSAQNLAWRKRNGHWHFVRYPTYFWKIQMFIMEKLKSIMPNVISKHLGI